MERGYLSKWYIQIKSVTRLKREKKKRKKRPVYFSKKTKSFYSAKSCRFSISIFTTVQSLHKLLNLLLCVKTGKCFTKFYISIHKTCWVIWTKKFWATRSGMCLIRGGRYIFSSENMVEHFAIHFLLWLLHATANVKLAFFGCYKQQQQKPKIFYEHESVQMQSSVQIFSLSSRHHIELICEMWLVK